MKTLTVLFALLFFLRLELSEVRKLYPDAAATKQSARDFHAKLAEVSDTDENKVLLAYRGAAETLLSKYANNVPAKVRHMKAGAKLIDAAVAAEGDNIEIRMIRLSVQENVPAIVGYTKNKKEDKAAIQAQFSKSNPAIQDYIKNFILRSKTFTEAEKATYK